MQKVCFFWSDNNLVYDSGMLLEAEGAISSISIYISDDDKNTLD